MDEKHRPKARKIGGEVKDEWETPPDIFVKYNHRYNFTLDVAASDENALCSSYYTEETNGLEMPWTGRVWCNPPYSNWRPWVAKADAEMRNYQRCCMLLPVDTSTKAFHKYIWNEDHPRPLVTVEFIPKRLRFYYQGEPGAYPARFASMVVTFKGHWPLETATDSMHRHFVGFMWDQLELPPPLQPLGAMDQ